MRELGPVAPSAVCCIRILAVHCLRLSAVCYVRLSPAPHTKLQTLRKEAATLHAGLAPVTFSGAAAEGVAEVPVTPVERWTVAGRVL